MNEDDDIDKTDEAYHSDANYQEQYDEQMDEPDDEESGSDDSFFGGGAGNNKMDQLSTREQRH